jgi:hypothetical protein
MEVWHYDYLLCKHYITFRGYLSIRTFLEDGDDTFFSERLATTDHVVS